MGSLEIHAIMKASLILFSCLLAFSVAQNERFKGVLSMLDNGFSGLKMDNPPGFCEAKARRGRCVLYSNNCNTVYGYAPQISGNPSTLVKRQCCCQCCDGNVPKCGTKRCTTGGFRRG